jgi:hypothetical protein
MKKLIFVLLLSLFVINAKGNIAEFRPFIYEFHLDEDGSWHLELGYIWWNYPGMLDGMILESSSNSFGFNEGMGDSFDNCDYYHFMELFSQSNFNLPEFFNPAGDFIRFISYGTSGEFETFITFGNYPNADYPCFGAGKSLIKLDNGFSGFQISNEPSLGFCNDYNNVYGHFSGVILDPTEEPFPGGFFSIPGSCQDISFDSYGAFDTEILTGSYSFDTLVISCSSYPFGSGKYVTEPVVFCLCPDSSFYCVVKTIDIITNITEPKVSYENTVTVSPNPFVEKATFYFNYENMELYDQISIKIFNADGVLVIHEPLNTRQASFVWYPSEPIKSGMLVYHFIKNDQVIKTGKIIKH